MSGDEPIRGCCPTSPRRPSPSRSRPLDLVALAHPERPYVITNFALTLDGHATISGRSGPIGSATDTAMLVGLRTRVDAVMIGAGTMRAERYGRVIGDPAKRERREAEGLLAGSADGRSSRRASTCPGTRRCSPRATAGS